MMSESILSVAKPQFDAVMPCVSHNTTYNPIVLQDGAHFIRFVFVFLTLFLVLVCCLDHFRFGGLPIQVLDRTQNIMDSRSHIQVLFLASSPVHLQLITWLKKTLPPIKDWGFPLDNQAANQSYKGYDPFITPKHYRRPIEPVNHSPARPNSSEMQRLGTQTAHVTLMPLGGYVANSSPLLYSSFNDATMQKPRSRASMRVCTDSASSAGKTIVYGYRQTETGTFGKDEENQGRKGKSKLKNAKHADSEKDRRKIMNFYIAILKKLTPSECCVDVKSKSNQEGEGVAKVEVLRYAVGFMIALVHRLDMEYSAHTALRDEMMVLRKERQALEHEISTLRRRWNDHFSCPESMNERSSLHQKSYTYEINALETLNGQTGRPHPTPNHNPPSLPRSSSVSYYRQCLQSPRCRLWLDGPEGVIASTISILRSREARMAPILAKATQEARAREYDLVLDARFEYAVD